MYRKAMVYYRKEYNQYTRYKILYFPNQGPWRA